MIIVDFACKRIKGIFAAFAVLVIEPMKEIAKTGDLHISFHVFVAWHKRVKAIIIVNLLLKRTSIYAYSIDFMQKNCKKEEEILHRVTWVEGLHCNTNAQLGEQLYSKFGYKTRFKNEIKPVNHIFLFWSNVNLFNAHITTKTITNLQRQLKHEMKMNELTEQQEIIKFWCQIISKQKYAIARGIAPKEQANSYL